ncbi:MAG: DUF87 domain-containing protein [Thermoleophilaceae bacterium]|nr:DUF87 domain-containing protein [Thermoleophilaceae bacterium]
MRDVNEKRGHRVTTANFKAAYPFQAEAGFGSEGVYIGQSRLGSAFCFDPWVLYNKKVLTNPNVMIFGEIGSGKSALVKSFLSRELIFKDRRAVIVDPKGEYGPLANAWGAEPIRLEPGGKVRLNPLNPRGGPEMQLGVLLAVAAAAQKKPLAPVEQRALTVVLGETAAKESEPTIPMIVHGLLHPTKNLCEALKLDKSGTIDAVRGSALALQNLCEGPLQGMFDGPSTGDVDFSKRIVVLNLEAFYGGESIGILMACASAWLRAEIAMQRKHDQRIKNFWVIDEGWKIIAHEGVGEWLQDSYKHSRSYGICNIMVLHRVSDLMSAGDGGSRIEALARGLLEDTGTHVIYPQGSEGVQGVEKVYRLTSVERDVIATAKRGTGLWLVGRTKAIVHHDLSPDEWQIIDTDARMGAEDSIAA